VHHATPGLVPGTRRNDSVLGILLMLAGFFMFSASDAMAKFLTESFHPVQIAWARYMGLFVGAMILLGIHGFSLLRTEKPILQFARAAVGTFSAICFIVAVAYVPLADAVAVAFVAPFMVTIMAALILREPVGIRRWTAVCIGFVGAMIVIRPGLGVVHPAALLIILAALLFAVRQIISRWLSDSDRTVTTIAFTGIIGAVLLTLPLPFVWITPVTWTEAALLVGIAVFGALGEILVIKALEVAHAVILAPLQYTMLIWGILYGYLIFSDLPDQWTMIGALIIMATGLYTLHRERVVSRQRARAARIAGS